MPRYGYWSGLLVVLTLILTACPVIQTPASNPMQPAGPAVSLNLGGASLNTPASLELPLDPKASGLPLVLEPSSDGITHVHAAGQAVGAASLRPLEIASTYAVPRAGSHGVLKCSQIE